MTNGHGGFVSTRNQEMFCYDQLPKAIREVIADLPFSYSAVALLQLWKQMKGFSRTEDDALASFIHFLKIDAQKKMDRNANPIPPCRRI